MTSTTDCSNYSTNQRESCYTTNSNCSNNSTISGMPHPTRTYYVENSSHSHTDSTAHTCTKNTSTSISTRSSSTIATMTVPHSTTMASNTSTTTQRSEDDDQTGFSSMPNAWTLWGAQLCYTTQRLSPIPIGHYLRIPLQGNSTRTLSTLDTTTYLCSTSPHDLPISTYKHVTSTILISMLHLCNVEQEYLALLKVLGKLRTNPRYLCHATGSEDQRANQHDRVSASRTT